MRRRGAGSVGRWADARDMEEAGRLPDGSADGILHHLWSFDLFWRALSFYCAVGFK